MAGEQLEPIIQLRGIFNQFGKQRIHDGIDLNIHRGEILGLIGGSGAGKSVLVNTILGLNKPQAGSVYFNGLDIPRLNPKQMLKIQKLWGVLFQHGALFSGLSVSENIQLPMMEHTTITPRLMKELSDVKLKLVGLPIEAGAKFPSQLSGGMIKRASLARALALDPLILFLDEPTAGLDPISAAAFDDLILYLKETLNLTVIIITHDLDSLVRICDRIAVLVDKKIIVDSLENLMQHDHPWIHDYFHGPRMRAVQDNNKREQGEALESVKI